MANSSEPQRVSASVTDLGERDATCGEHGAYVSKGQRFNLFAKREHWTGCPQCVALARAAEQRAEAEKRAEHARKLIAEQLDAIAIPSRFIGRTFDTFEASTPEQTHALAITRDYAANFNALRKQGAGLVLSGQPGTGKSHLAGAILQALLPQHVGLYVTCMDLIRMVRATWRRDSEKTEGEVLTMLGRVALLVIDEIGVQYGTDGEQTVLFDVLDRRYREQRPVVLLTNQGRKGFREFIGDRSYDRLRETSRWVPFEWPSYRQRMSA
jgi:DNA replication protein DnaC